ncbi:hypothetical protein SKAU_G00267500 [Synaphobranchus kaupii]|uniref:Uncharacterized protein n=1 Tax=Synaphobranchus kaupii TaxID=118154 RepID=A0A9Q1EZX3_SYNKA|nr:hypothetical protein SKAU_G00267500 [Synaphobranchus kaupii]
MTGLGVSLCEDKITKSSSQYLWSHGLMDLPATHTPVALALAAAEQKRTVSPFGTLLPATAWPDPVKAEGPGIHPAVLSKPASDSGKRSRGSAQLSLSLWLQRGRWQPTIAE